MNTSNKMNPFVLVLVIFLVAVNVINLFILGSKVIVFGGESSVESVVATYQTAINTGDADLYLSIVPAVEKSRSEKKYIKENIKDYAGKDYKIAIVDKTKQPSIDNAEDFAKLVMMDPFFFPIIKEKNILTVKVSGADEFTTKLTVYRIGDRYFLDDVSFAF